MNQTLIIAEAGVNHNGDISTAKELIDVAAEAGVDFVKFQSFKSKNLVTSDAKKADYQVKNTQSDDSQLAMLQKLELSEADHHELIDYCRSRGVEFLSTAFDMESIEFLHSLDLPLAKIPSGEITNLPYLRKIAEYWQRIILSTGMATMDEIKAALQVLTDCGTKLENITVLHCNTEYPTPMQDVNLRAMHDIAHRCQVKVGYSDHTLGIEVPIAAVALGGTVIEKHFTLSRDLPGPDHRASLEPDELKAMVKSLRNVEIALSGSGKKEPSASEAKNKAIARKSIVAAQQIQKGDLFTDQNLTIKRPGTGISPMHWDELIGQTATRDFQEDEIIER